ncbi:MAG: hypothetical protein KC800_01005, partial [Candidatus Eremiobacteraeota bacterium]|nr:hypothetical protein [Candidatus Eremiobacteraeota bacterium]
QAICFAGGIGENSPPIRRQVCEGMESLGLKLDQDKNEKPMEDSRGWIISTEDSPIKIYVIPTDEELLIARDTVRSV